MKKLMITLTAAALAFGLRAADEGFKAGTSFEDGVAPSAETGWTLPEGDDNRVLTVTDYAEGEAYGNDRPAQYTGDNTKYLDLRTTFGKPVELNVEKAEMGGIYFDSLVKFTACDEDPVADTYENAKLIVYTKELEDGSQKLFVMAGNLAGSENEVTATAYDCGVWEKGDKWVRLTIKTIADMGAAAPGFVVFIDGEPVGSSASKGDTASAMGNLNNVGAYWNKQFALFPSLVQTGAKGTVTSVGFDGQGKIDDLAFTTTIPDFCSDPSFFTITWNENVIVTSVDGKKLEDEAQTAGSYVANYTEPKTIKVVYTLKPDCVLDTENCTVSGATTTDWVDFNITGAAASANIAAVLAAPKMNVVVDGVPYEGSTASFAKVLEFVNSKQQVAEGAKISISLIADVEVGMDEEGFISEFMLDSYGEVVLDLAGHKIIGVAKGADFEDAVIDACSPLTIIDSVGGGVIKVAAEAGEGYTGVVTADGTTVTLGNTTTDKGVTFDGVCYGDNGGEFVVVNGKFSGAAESFYLADSLADGREAKYADGYWTVAAVEKTGWALYLAQGENENEFLIQDEEDLIEFATYMETSEDFATTGVTFKQTANIDLDGEIWDGPGESRTTTGAFMGVYDGNGKTISNLTLAKKEYNGFIGCMAGASQLKNLTILVKGFGDGSATNYGGAGAVGFSMGTDVLVENVTVKGQTAETELNGTHNIAGIGCRLEGKITLRNCTNELNLASNYSKVGGICAIASTRDATGDITFDGCVNKGNARVYGANGGTTGLSGILGYIETAKEKPTAKKLTITNCENTGTLTADSTATAAKIGSIAAYLGGYTRGTISGNTAKADVLAVANGRSCDGLNFATVTDGVATFVADSAVVAGGTYKVMADGALAITLANVGDSITLDTTLATATVNTTAENAYVKQEGNVYTVTAKTDYSAAVLALASETAVWADDLGFPTYTVKVGEDVVPTDAYTAAWDPETIAAMKAGDEAKTYTLTVTFKAGETVIIPAAPLTKTFTVTAPAPSEDWDNPAVDIEETTTAEDAWPSLAGTALATANAGKLQKWAETQKINFADAASIKVDAFLLDCANTDEAVKAAKAEFKVTSLTQDAEGNWVAKVGTVGDGEAYKNGYVAIVKVTIEGADKANSKFYQATLNLQPAVK